MTTFIPTADVARAAEFGLDLRRRFGRGGTAVGVARARDLSNQRPVSDRTVRRMASYFARHAVDADAAGSPSRGYWGDNQNPSAGWIAWLLWGGDPGRRWVERQMATNKGNMKRATRKNPTPKRKVAEQYVTKPGRHGTLYLWDVKVIPADPGHGPYHVKMWSADIDLLHDRLVYDDMLAGDDWEILGRVKQSLTDKGPQGNPAHARTGATTRKRNPSDIVKAIKGALPKGYSVWHHARGSLSGTVSIYPPVAFDTKEWCEVSRKLRRMFPGVDFGGSLAAESFCAYRLDYSPSEQERHLAKIEARLARIPAPVTEHLSSAQALSILDRAGRRNPGHRSRKGSMKGAERGARKGTR